MRACVRVCVCVSVRVCVSVHAFLRECVSVSARVRCYVRVNQCVAPPCIDQKRGPNSRLLLNLIPGRPFTMFSISLYDDIRTKEASQKEEFCGRCSCVHLRGEPTLFPGWLVYQ